MIATLYTAEAFTCRPRILDVDDAIWLRGRGSSSRTLARNADLVICGNEYLAEVFAGWNRNVAVLPTAVDTDRYTPSPEWGKTNGRPVIGWSGTSGGFRYLRGIARALAITLRRVPGAVFRVIADLPPVIPELGNRIEFVPWSPEKEILELRKFSVGIMPLDDTSWSRGKCAFKLLTYMSCGLPVLGSPVGMSADVLAAAGADTGPQSESEWVDSMTRALLDSTWARTTGERGRQSVLQRFSLRVLAPRFAELLRGTARTLR
jgi:glycosyltransferase involved in cell wall biosynthesis